MFFSKLEWVECNWKCEFCTPHLIWNSIFKRSVCILKAWPVFDVDFYHMYRCDQTSQNRNTRCALVLSCIKLLLTGFEWPIIEKTFIFTTMRTPPCHAQRPPILPHRPNAPWRFQKPPWGAITPPLRNTGIGHQRRWQEKTNSAKCDSTDIC